jgi:16S rRNA (uracil1498-N3)-methyltransferase
VIDLADSAAHVVVDDVAAPVLGDADRHHLSRVLRLRSGERVTVTDGRGAWQWCVWSGEDLRSDGDGGSVPPPAYDIGVALALIKGDRLDWAVQKLTELGVDRILPMAAEHGVVRWTADKARTNVDRLRRIAHEAAMQSRRVRLPIIEDVVPVADVLSRPGVVRADFGGIEWSEAPASVWAADPATPRIVAVGPEGGWSASERSVGGPVVGLGDEVLRAETAAISAGVLLAHTRRSTR